MQVVNEVIPSDPEQMRQMMASGPDEPIYMINLLKFKARAEYEDGRESDLSGREAYEIYGREVVKLVTKFNGAPVFAGDVTFLAIGQVEELWDEVAIVKYDRRSDLLAMSMSPEWQAISVHRAAGLKGQLNIETTAAGMKS